jgi:glycosyltransferase involved in cell wall biosynthesis
MMGALAWFLLSGAPPMMDALKGRRGIALSVVIPVYNNADCLDELSGRLCGTFSAAEIENYEVIFVDDGSRDHSRDVLRRLCQQNPRIKLIALTRNFGHQFAITAGFDSTRGDAVLVMDADLQDPPEVIPEFLAKWREGYDVVYGVRVERPGESWFKRSTAALFYRLLRRLTSTDVPMDSGDFRLLSRRAMDAFNGLRERTRFVRGMVSWLGYPQAPVLYKRAPRLAGKSEYSLPKLVKLALDGVFSFSDIPLRIASWMGFAGVGMCLAYLGYAMVQKLLWGVPVPGWASLVALVLFIGSVQLTVLGVLGQYVGRMFEELKGRPLYVIQERIGFEEAPDPPR